MSTAEPPPTPDVPLLGVDIEATVRRPRSPPPGGTWTVVRGYGLDRTTAFGRAGTPIQPSVPTVATPGERLS